MNQIAWLGWSGWTDELTDVLREHALAGLSASQSAKILGTTRNSAIGRAHRHGIKFGGGAGAGTVDRAPKPKPRAKPVTMRAAKVTYAEPLPEMDAQLAGRHPKTLLELGSLECRWPLGKADEPAELFCADPVKFDKHGSATSWCPCHSARVFSGVPLKPIKPYDAYTIARNRAAAYAPSVAAE